MGPWSISKHNLINTKKEKLECVEKFDFLLEEKEEKIMANQIIDGSLKNPPTHLISICLEIKKNLFLASKETLRTKTIAHF